VRLPAPMAVDLRASLLSGGNVIFFALFCWLAALDS